MKLLLYYKIINGYVNSKNTPTKLISSSLKYESSELDCKTYKYEYFPVQFKIELKLILLICFYLRDFSHKI